MQMPMEMRTVAMLARPMSRSPRMMAAAASSGSYLTELSMPLSAPASAPSTSTKDVVQAIVKATELQLALKRMRAHRV